MTRLLLVAAVVVVLAAAGVGAGTAAGATWVVDGDGGADFTRIQDAIDNASVGDTIFVYNGTYYENLKINKDNLTIVGETMEGVIIDGSDKLYTVEIVSGVDNIEICELSIQNSSNGIFIGWSNFNRIVKNRIFNCYGGIAVLGLNNNISENIIMNNSVGIKLYGDDNMILDNVISNNSKGIWIMSNYNVILRNDIVDGHKGISGPDGITISSSSNHDNQISYNTILNNPGCGISVYYSNNEITNNYISNNGEDGVKVVYGDDNNIIINNTIVNNTGYDIHIGSYCDDNIVINNTARRIHGDLLKNDIYNNIYSRPIVTSTFTENPPTINGVIEEGEWKNKIEIKLNGFETDDHYNGAKNEKLTKTADLYVMNDADNIYIAVMIEDTSKGDEDFLYFGFDQDDDFVHTDGNEDMAYLDGKGYADTHWDAIDVATWYRDDALPHGEMRRAWSPADRIYVYELMKPLDSGDPHDMKLKAGDTVGFRIEAYDSYPGIYYRYPMDTVDHDVVHSEDENIIFTYPVGDESGAWKKWADLEIAKEGNQPPIANFTHSPEDAFVNQIITFNASFSHDPDGSITNYEWCFGDGNVTNTAEPALTHSYTCRGNYTVTLTVVDDAGSSDAETKNVIVSAKGDLNCNGEIDSTDALICLQIAVGSRPLDVTTLAAADVSGDGSVTSLDALMILQAVAGAIVL